MSHEDCGTFFIAADDFDKSLLPPDARTPGTEAFKEAVIAELESQYADVGGWVRVSVSDEAIQVDWRADATTPDPVDVAISKLQQGDIDGGAAILETLRHQQPENLDILYNLAMVYSDRGRLGEAVSMLRRLLEIDSAHINALVALGVALYRDGRPQEAAKPLREAVDAEPRNPWAHRNLGAVMLALDNHDVGIRHLESAVELAPSDPQAHYGLAEGLLHVDKLAEADKHLKEAIRLAPNTPVAEAAKRRRSQLAQKTMRAGGAGGPRPDAVMYCLSALDKFATMPPEEVKRVAFEIAMLGQRGIDPNDPEQKYSLQALPGRFSGLHLLSYMYVAFKQVAPDHSIGFDLDREYDVALQMHRKQSGQE